MPRVIGCNDRQSSFLRSFRSNPSGPPPKDWPSPAILRRWLRRPSFRSALQSIQSTLRIQESFLLTAASSTALRTLDPVASSPDIIRHTLALLRLSHLRHLFDATTSPPPHPPKKPQPTIIPKSELAPFILPVQP